MPQVNLTIDGVSYQCTPVSAGGSTPAPTPAPTQFPASGTMPWPPAIGASGAVDLQGKDMVAAFDVPAGFTGSIQYQLTQNVATGPDVKTQAFITDSPGGGTLPDTPGAYMEGYIRNSMTNDVRIPGGKTYYVRALSEGSPGAHFTILLKP
jgi:hypothetical protein